MRARLPALLAAERERVTTSVRATTAGESDLPTEAFAEAVAALLA